MDKNIVDGPTGETCLDLPSPYQAHYSGLLHLPRFLAKIKKHLLGNLPTSYQRNFTKGFDGFLCLHLGLEPDQIIECVKSSESEEELEIKLAKIFPPDLKPHIWNRKVVQMGTADMAKEKLAEVKSNLGAANREDLISFADIIDFDERKIT
jgi:hypothetical protein